MIPSDTAWPPSCRPLILDMWINVTRLVLVTWNGQTGTAMTTWNHCQSLSLAVLYARIPRRWNNMNKKVKQNFTPLFCRVFVASVVLENVMSKKCLFIWHSAHIDIFEQRAIFRSLECTKSWQLYCHPCLLLSVIRAKSKNSVTDFCIMK